jgi:hypothetical protein
VGEERKGKLVCVGLCAVSGSFVSEWILPGYCLIGTTSPFVGCVVKLIIGRFVLVWFGLFVTD